jgi:hypothetical protein
MTTAPAADYGDGNVKVLWVPALADPTNPTTAEVTAVGVVDLTDYLTNDGFNPTTDQQATTDERLGSRQTFKRAGRYTNSLSLRYVYRQQAAVGATDNKAFTTLRHLTQGYVVARWGKAYEVAMAAADKVDVWPAECGYQVKLPKEDNATLKIEQEIFVRSAVAQDATVAA